MRTVNDSYILGLGYQLVVFIKSCYCRPEASIYIAVVQYSPSTDYQTRAQTKTKEETDLGQNKTQKSRIFTFGTIMIKIICRNLATVAKEPGPTTLMSHTKVLTTVTPSNFGNSSKLPPRKFSTIGSGNITHHTITFNGNGINTVGK